MKKSNKLLLGLASIAMIATPLIGCSNNGGGEVDDGKIHIVFGHTFGDKVETALNKFITQFTQKVKAQEDVDVVVELQYLGGYSDVYTKVNTYFTDGTCPTMTIAYPDTVADFIKSFGTQYVVNFDKYMNDPELAFGTDRYLGDTEGKDDIITSYLEEGQKFVVEGTYSLPFMKSSEIMLYNLDYVTEVMKIYNPTAVETGKVEETIASYSWTQLLDFASVAYAHRGDIEECAPEEAALKHPIFYDSDSNLFITQMFQEGFEYSSIQGGKGHIDFDDGPDGENYLGAKQLLEEYLNWHNLNLFTTKGAEGTYASNSFKNQECIFTIGSSGGSGYTFPQAGEFTVGMCKVPARNDKPYYISQGPSVCFIRNPHFSDAKNDLIHKYAWKFLKYLMSTNVNTSLCITGSEGYAPVRTSCYSTEAYIDFMGQDDDYARAAKVLTDEINGHFISSAVFTGSATLRTQVGAAVTGLLSGKITDVATALNTAINNAKIDMES